MTELEKLDYVFNEITKEDDPHPVNTEKKWVCNKCDKEVVGLEHHQPNGADSTDLVSVQCAECGTTLWND